jgi:hypothetical protein
MMEMVALVDVIGLVRGLFLLWALLKLLELYLN